MTSKSSLQISLRKPLAGASAGHLNDFETRRNIKIPAEYRQFLLHQNGGVPVNRTFSYGDQPYQDSVIRSFLGVQCRRAFDVGFILDQYEDRLSKHYFPIAVDESDNLVLISQKRGSARQVYFWSHELELTEPNISFVAKDLGLFLGILQEDKTAVLDIATVTYGDGETKRYVLPFNVESIDRDAVIDLRNIQTNERIDDFGKVRQIVAIVFSQERHVV